METISEEIKTKVADFWSMYNENLAYIENRKKTIELKCEEMNNINLRDPKLFAKNLKYGIENLLSLSDILNDNYYLYVEDCMENDKEDFFEYMKDNGFDMEDRSYDEKLYAFIHGLDK